MTYHQIIVKYLEEYGDWIEGYKLSKVETNFGYLGSSAERRLRELAERGEIERKQEGKYVYYRKIKKQTGFYKVETGEIVPIYS